MQAPLFYALPSIEVIDVAKILFAMSHLAFSVDCHLNEVAPVRLWSRWHPRPFLTYG